MASHRVASRRLGLREDEGTERCSSHTRARRPSPARCLWEREAGGHPGAAGAGRGVRPWPRCWGRSGGGSWLFLEARLEWAGHGVGGEKRAHSLDVFVTYRCIHAAEGVFRIAASTSANRSLSCQDAPTAPGVGPEGKVPLGGAPGPRAALPEAWTWQKLEIAHGRRSGHSISGTVLSWLLSLMQNRAHKAACRRAGTWPPGEGEMAATSGGAGGRAFVFCQGKNLKNQ